MPCVPAGSRHASWSRRSLMADHHEKFKEWLRLHTKIATIRGQIAALHWILHGNALVGYYARKVGRELETLRAEVEKLEAKEKQMAVDMADAAKKPNLWTPGGIIKPKGV